MRYEYKVAGKTVSLETDDDLVAVRFRPATPTSTKAWTVTDSGARFGDRLALANEAFTIVPVAPAALARPDRVKASVAKLELAKSVDRVAPVFRLGAGHAVATDRVLLRFQGAGDDGAWLLAGHPGRRLGWALGSNDEATLTLGADEDPLAVAHGLATDERLAYAEPDFVNIQPRLPRGATGPGPSTADPLLAKQYAMRQIGAIEAWKHQLGVRDVKVAILDEGVDTRHEDLQAVVDGGFDATEGDVFQEPNSWDGHGTACAGLAVGIGDNGLGIAGVGRGCGLLAVRIAKSVAEGQPWQWANERAAAGIDWSWRNGASVLSNSWGGGAPSNRIADAFDRARTRGRGGLGCVVVVAVGNDSREVAFPATLTGVVAVAASNEADEPKTKTSADGEHWWGSCFGPEVSLAAPGVHNYTTDITGTGGYNGGGAVDASYTPDFNGTSSAAPLVAGAAALILSAKPTLREVEVREILRDTAAKVGSIPYVDGRNDHMGYGRLDIQAAVEKARR